MQLIECPHCGPREETEFHYGAAAGIAYPPVPADLDDEAWAHYLFFRPNPKGVMTERWFHGAGCRQWFTVDRDTVTYQFVGTPTVSRVRPGIDVADGAPS
ncbi:sarcosine oxidase subunit delta [Gordonia sp. LSe1-13]|uniref:Sarcosine oxidase subunit delta n=1 Tax=Gordonia sesuvii TaxID=3116777 RepID=A0ABU7MH11_9ACTN|nr:sarcosine oxidase subunit delta [Gordonia sp. LSe1-13]